MSSTTTLWNLKNRRRNSREIQELFSEQNDFGSPRKLPPTQHRLEVPTSMLIEFSFFIAALFCWFSFFFCAAVSSIPVTSSLPFKMLFPFLLALSQYSFSVLYFTFHVGAQAKICALSENKLFESILVFESCS